MKGITLKCHSKAEMADISMTKVKPLKAKMKVPPGLEISNGAPGAPSAR